LRFVKCTLANIQKDPDEWFHNIEYLNAWVKKISKESKKSKIQLKAHVIANYPSEYLESVTAYKNLGSGDTTFKKLKKSIWEVWLCKFKPSVTSKKDDRGLTLAVDRKKNKAEGKPLQVWSMLASRMLSQFTTLRRVPRMYAT
jgi:hypothetical protein